MTTDLPPGEPESAEPSHEPLRGIPASGELAFQALRNGTAMGTHTLTFSSAGDAMTVAIAVDYFVKTGPVAEFHYRLRSSEHWRGKALVSARSEANDNGSEDWMLAERHGDSLVVQGSKSGTYRAPAGVILASLWNHSRLKEPMINPQDGRLCRYEVTPQGPASVKDTSGEVLPARRFSLSGNEGMIGRGGLDLWYDAKGVWAALQAKAADGAEIRYVRIA